MSDKKRAVYHTITIKYTLYGAWPTLSPCGKFYFSKTEHEDIAPARALSRSGIMGDGAEVTVFYVMDSHMASI